MGADLTIVVPTYNERERLGSLLEQIFSACDADGPAVAVVVVDDNSADGTGDLADEWARGGRVRVIHRAGSSGWGAPCSKDLPWPTPTSSASSTPI